MLYSVIKLQKSNQRRTDGPTDGPTDRVAYNRVSCARVKKLPLCLDRISYGHMIKTVCFACVLAAAAGS